MPTASTQIISRSVENYSNKPKYKSLWIIIVGHSNSSLLQSEFAKVLGLNDELASDYHQLQCNFIDAKRQALKVIEKKLKMESSLRDHQQVHISGRYGWYSTFCMQLLAFQSSLYSSLQDYYMSRQIKSREALNLFRRESKWNLEQLGSVRGRLENILSLIMGFMQQEHLQDWCRGEGNHNTTCGQLKSFLFSLDLVLIFFPNSAVLIMGCVGGGWENDAKSLDYGDSYQTGRWIHDLKKTDWFFILKQSNFLLEFGLFPHGLFAKLCTIHFENILQEKEVTKQKQAQTLYTPPPPLPPSWSASTRNN